MVRGHGLIWSIDGVQCQRRANFAIARCREYLIPQLYCFRVACANRDVAIYLHTKICRKLDRKACRTMRLETAAKHHLVCRAVACRWAALLSLSHVYMP